MNFWENNWRNNPHVGVVLLEIFVISALIYINSPI